MSFCWLALVVAPPVGADAAAPVTELDGEPAGYLAAWSREPDTPALRADPRIIDPAGRPAFISLVLAPPGVRLAFDDTAVQQARRRVLAGRPAAAVSTLLSDDSRFEGALTAWRAGPGDDPFARIFPARVLRLGAGLIGDRPPPCGPTIERYGSATPWPWDRFGM